MKRKRRYILYRYNHTNDDIEYIKEYLNINELRQDINLKNNKSIFNNIVYNIDNGYKHLIDKKYLIISEEY